MTRVLEYRDYTARIEFDATDGVFVGRGLTVTNRISFHSESFAKLTDAFHMAIDHYLAGRTKQSRKWEKLVDMHRYD